MNPPGVVKIHIMLNTETELRQADILFDFDVLIFQRPPETFHFCIIQTSSPSVLVMIDREHLTSVQIDGENENDLLELKRLLEKTTMKISIQVNLNLPDF